MWEMDILSKLFENHGLTFWSNICKTILTFRKSIQDLRQQNYNLTPFITDTKKTSYTKKISLEILSSLKYPTSKRIYLTIFDPTLHPLLSSFPVSSLLLTEDWKVKGPTRLTIEAFETNKLNLKIDHNLHKDIIWQLQRHSKQFDWKIPVNPNDILSVDLLIQDKMAETSLANHLSKEIHRQSFKNYISLLSLRKL